MKGVIAPFEWLRSQSDLIEYETAYNSGGIEVNRWRFGRGDGWSVTAENHKPIEEPTRFYADKFWPNLEAVAAIYNLGADAVEAMRYSH